MVLELPSAEIFLTGHHKWPWQCDHGNYSSLAKGFLLPCWSWKDEPKSGALEVYTEVEQNNSREEDCAGLKCLIQAGGRRPRAHRGWLGKRAHGSRLAIGTATASWHHHCQDVLQKDTVTSLQGSQNVFSQAHSGHYSPPACMQPLKEILGSSGPGGWRRPKTPQPGKGDVSLATLATVSLQSIK